MNVRSEESMGQEFNKSSKLRILRQKSEVRRGQEMGKSMVLRKPGEINRILKVKAGTESNSLENLKQWHS